MEGKLMKILVLGVLLLSLALPRPAPAQEVCPYQNQGDLALALADTLGIISGPPNVANAIAALNAVGIYPGALGDVLPPPETDGWVANWPVTNDIFCEQLIYLVWAAAKVGAIVTDPEEAVTLVLGLAGGCGVDCPGPPPEEVVIIPPPSSPDDPEEEEPLSGWVSPPGP